MPKHFFLYTLQTQKRKQPTLAQATASKAPYDPSSAKAQRIQHFLTRAICLDALLFRFVDSLAIWEWLYECNPSVRMPTRQALSDVLVPKLSEESTATINKEILKLETMAVMTDMWTLTARDPYMGVTVHFIDKNWNLTIRCLAVRSAPRY